MDEVKTLFDAICSHVGKDKYSKPPFNMSLNFELSDQKIDKAMSELQMLLNNRYPNLQVTINAHRDSRNLVVDFTPQ